MLPGALAGVVAWAVESAGEGGQPAPGAPLWIGSEFEKWSKFFTSSLAGLIELCAAVIIGLAAVQATALALRLFVVRTAPASEKEAIRLQLGRWLAIALEFELAADILRTAVAPTWNDIGQLAAIVVLRTVLNYFLQKEIDRATGGRGDGAA